MAKEENQLRTLHRLSQGESEQMNRMSTTSATRKAGQFKCVGAIRKAGFLSVKKWIIKRRQSIELARKQGWKRYWVCLRGTALLFHSVVDRKDADDDNEKTDLLSWIQMNCNNNMRTNLLQSTGNGDQLNISQCYIEREPRHLIIIEGAIAQPIPEHPKRDHIFCLSTTFGDAYLFQASCQSESDNWISAVHNACAASIARDLTRDETIKLFETKIRHLELESEKKLFLRQRLESRLTSMSSMSHISALVCGQVREHESTIKTDAGQRAVTMRSLLQRLNQQLMTLETYIEQLHCEVYQLRCYLSSCGAQQIFYQSMQQKNSTNSHFPSIELPHPKSLLMHVSKPTKLLLIKIGVFTVSSFHAYIHARQGSAETILKRIQQCATLASGNSDSPIELMVRSHSISALSSSNRNIELEHDTEELIQITDLKPTLVRINKKLFNKIRGLNEDCDELLVNNDEEDDRYSLRIEADFVSINMKLHSNTNCLVIIKYLLKIIRKSNEHFKNNTNDFLEYYLKLTTIESDQSDDHRKNLTDYVAKRRDTLSDWAEFEYLELFEKMIFKIELNRKRTDEESTPFGISIGAQLILNRFENLLNVYCSYIEWGSVADKAGLKDDDELLMINGVPVMDLDMMFIECIIQDESRLKLIVRSSRFDCPQSAIMLDKATWKPFHPDKDGNDGLFENNENFNNDLPGLPIPESQVISDEYISSLVCPPPPSQMNAFLRTDSTILRQKSDLTNETVRKNYICKTEPLADENERGSRRLKIMNPLKTKAKSQQELNDDNLEKQETIPSTTTIRVVSKNDHGLNLKDADYLAGQLMKKTEQLTQLLGKNSITITEWEDKVDMNVNIDSLQESCDNKLSSSQTDHNSLERLKKCVIELLETEYAFVKHLETINEHYMNPLSDSSFLEIQDLKLLNRIIDRMMNFQKKFYEKLTKDMLSNCTIVANTSNDEVRRLSGDEFDEINRIVQRIESFYSLQEMRSTIEIIAKTFTEESEKFKLYSIYCAKYSKLQKLLHPRRIHNFSNLIASLPNSLDTFQTSNVLGMSSNINIGSGGSQNHRDFLKPLGSFMTSNSTNSNELDTQLRQLGEFLSNLDSSSSSASLSLPKSSSSISDQQQQQQSSSTSEQKRSTSKTTSYAKTTSEQAVTSQKLSSCVHQQNFESYLIKPIQRIVKYPMLLNSIAISMQNLECCEETLNNLKTAIRLMESITSFVNDAQRVYDEYGPIFEHIERQYLDKQHIESIKAPTLITGPHQPNINLNIEELLHFGPIDWLNINEYAPKLKKGARFNQILFVFNSCVLFICKEQIKSAKKRIANNGASSGSQINLHNRSQFDLNEVIRYQTLIPVSEVQVSSVLNTGGTSSGDGSTSASSSGYQWELFRCSSVNSNSNLLTKKSSKRNSGGKIYLLSSSTNEGRNTFLRKIRSIIRESVRNMSLPLARVPSSKSSTPKKVSSPSSITATINRTNSSSCSQSTSYVSPIRCSAAEEDDDDSKQTSDIQNNRYKARLGNGSGANQVKENSNFTARIKVNN